MDGLRDLLGDCEHRDELLFIACLEVVQVLLVRPAAVASTKMAAMQNESASAHYASSMPGVRRCALSKASDHKADDPPPQLSKTLEDGAGTKQKSQFALAYRHSRQRPESPLQKQEDQRNGSQKGPHQQPKVTLRINLSARVFSFSCSSVILHISASSGVLLPRK